ncbi:MAG: hypothetical protein ACRD16_14710 [Thermoanaerobaculia bacterium]
MTHSVTYDPDADVVVLAVRGEVTLGVIRLFVDEIALLARQQDCYRVLSDFRDATLALSTFEIYELPRIIRERGASFGVRASRFKRALAVVPGSGDFSFFETVSRNQGQSVSLFRDIDEAKKWLIE